MSETAPVGGANPTTFLVDAGGSPTPEQLRAQQAALAAAAAPPTQQTVQMQPTGPAARWTDEDIERVRTEERSKLHSDLDRVKADLATIQTDRQAEIDRLQAEKDAADAATRAAEEEHMSAKALIARKDEEWTARFDAIEAQRATEQAVFERERRYAAVQEFKSAQVSLVLQNNEIIPNLADLISGATEEEILQSVEVVKMKSAEILNAVAAQQQREWQAMPGVQPTGSSAAGPLENMNGQKQYSAGDIQAMSDQEYARNRGQLLRAAGDAYRRGQR